MNKFDTHHKIYKLLNHKQNNSSNLIVYVNKENRFLWRNKQAINSYKQDPKGKTIFDIWSKDSALACEEDNKWIMNYNRNKKFYKKYEIELISGEKKKMFAIKTLLVTPTREIRGIITKGIDLEQLKNTTDELYRNDNITLLFHKMHTIYFNTKSFVKEMLFLSTSNLNNRQQYEELYQFSNQLLIDYENIFNSYGLIDIRHSPYTFNNINLRNLIKETIAQVSARLAENLRIKFILQICNKIPKVIIGDIFRTKKLIQFIIGNLIISTFKEAEAKTICLLKLYHNRTYNKTCIVSFDFKLFLKKNFSYNDTYPIFNISKIEMLVKELNGHLDISVDKDVCQIVINLPFSLSLEVF